MDPASLPAIPDEVHQAQAMSAWAQTHLAECLATIEGSLLAPQLQSIARAQAVCYAQVLTIVRHLEDDVRLACERTAGEPASARQAAVYAVAVQYLALLEPYVQGVEQALISFNAAHQPWHTGWEEEHARRVEQVRLLVHAHRKLLALGKLSEIAWRREWVAYHKRFTTGAAAMGAPLTRTTVR